MANPNGNPNWKPGVSGNPKGRPLGIISNKSKIQQAFLDIMNTQVKKGKSTMTYYDAFLQKLMKDALGSDIRARQFLAERLLQPDVLDSIDDYINRGKQTDLDFISYRIYKQAHNIQQKIILDKSSLIMLMAGRRSGKSEADILKGVEKATTKADARVLYIGLTISKCEQIFLRPIIEKLDDIGLNYTQDKTNGIVKLDNGSEIYFGGNSTQPERDRYRGTKWDIVFIDEAQSQSALPTLITEIIEPTLLDRKGQLVISGTGPRVRGTYWEEMWTNTEKFKGSRYNWNISDNPFIPDYQKVLEKIKEEKGLTDTSPLYIREYLGQISYDDDAMIYRMKDDNFYTEDELSNWISSQPVDDIRFTAGLDYGYVDSTAFIIICYSESKAEKFVVYEDKFNRSDVTELANRVKKGIEFVANSPLFNKSQTLPAFGLIQGSSQRTISKDFYVFCDTNEQMISRELQNTYNIPTINALKYDKALAIEMLQEEVRRGFLKVKDKNSFFYDESLKTIWKRNDKDELTREIDDETFHPDMMDATLYALRNSWIYNNKLGN